MASIVPEPEKEPRPLAAKDGFISKIMPGTAANLISQAIWSFFGGAAVTGFAKMALAAAWAAATGYGLLSGVIIFAILVVHFSHKLRMEAVAKWGASGTVLESLTVPVSGRVINVPEQELESPQPGLLAISEEPEDASGIIRLRATNNTGKATRIWARITAIEPRGGSERAGLPLALLLAEDLGGPCEPGGSVVFKLLQSMGPEEGIVALFDVKNGLARIDIIKQRYRFTVSFVAETGELAEQVIDFDPKPQRATIKLGDT